MRPGSIILAAAMLLLPLAGPALAGGKAHNLPVFRVDSATARIEGHRLVIMAKGAVRSGGWRHAHLHILPQKRAETDTLFVEFLASPPARGAAVIQALLPVSAKATVGLPRYATTKVTVRAETNQVTATITRGK